MSVVVVLAAPSVELVGNVLKRTAVADLRRHLEELLLAPKCIVLSLQFFVILA